ncbi:glyoxalase [Kaistella flava (ex Peng et al. 2021)]|uniref:Glyoxalase n=1 Tax=Kaistella flava (ex Peng et al. 2021) TaxID=2038776 RepID=A0A7M2Y991_9FLAO|nr:glyoxalase [Kaistella flava (ex Peng et al. 2021)]QOW10225.1 glyoxalase [Kaistella flava (ex Peng et al. 2021)]
MTNKLDLRPTLEIEILETSTAIEQFQNQTLRPILKLQNDIYASLFATYAMRQKADYDSLSGAKKRTFIEQSLQKDSVLKNTFIGITIGMFTLEEIETYSMESKEYNRRIITMLIERLKSETK